VEFRRRPREHDRALAQHDDLVAHGQRHACVLLHEQDRHALALEAEENALEFAHEQGRQTLRRLVEHEQVRVAGERARDGEHLLLPAREASSGLARPLAQDGEVVVNSAERPARTPADDALGQPEILRHVQVREDLPSLRHIADAEAEDAMRCLAGDLPPLEADDALPRGREAHDRSQRGRLAGAVASQQYRDAARRHCERHVAQHVTLTVIGLERFHAEQRVCGRRPR